MTADWIRDFRQAMGMSREAFARAVTWKLGGRGSDALTVTGELIGKLEEMNGCITHPDLADLIAAACGATVEQRDGIVHKRHRGTWPGVGVPLLLIAMRTTQRTEPREHKGNTRQVVVLDRTGNEVRRFDTLTEAAAFIGISRTSLGQRCRRIIPYEWQTGNQYTARYADEWDATPPAERLEALPRAGGLESGRNYENRSRTNVKKPVVMVDRQCRELGRWPSIADAEKGARISDTSISNRCARILKREWTPQFPFTFRFAEEWDAMSEEQRKADVGTV